MLRRNASVSSKNNRTESGCLALGRRRVNLSNTFHSSSASLFSRWSTFCARCLPFVHFELALDWSAIVEGCLLRQRLCVLQAPWRYRSVNSSSRVVTDERSPVHLQLERPRRCWVLLYDSLTDFGCAPAGQLWLFVASGF